MNRKTRTARATLVATSLAVAAAVALTGCSKDDGDKDTPTSDKTATATADPTAGASMGSDQIETAAEDGLAAFPSSDGSYVAIDPHQPLPATVVDDVVAGLGDLSEPAVDEDGVMAANATIYAALDRVNQTGMYGVVIVSTFTYDEAMVATPVVSVVTFAPGFDFTDPDTWVFTDAQAARDAVAATVAAQVDPTSYAVVDATA